MEGYLEGRGLIGIRDVQVAAVPLGASRRCALYASRPVFLFTLRSVRRVFRWATMGPTVPGFGHPVSLPRPPGFPGPGLQGRGRCSQPELAARSVVAPERHCSGRSDLWSGLPPGRLPKTARAFGPGIQPERPSPGVLPVWPSGCSGRRSARF